jgi:hypothetical protein
METGHFWRNPWKVHGTFRVRIKSLDAFDQTHYKFRHNGIVRPGLARAAGFFVPNEAATEYPVNAASHDRAPEECKGRHFTMVDVGTTQMVSFCERPQKGEEYEVITAFTASVLTVWKAPFTGGYEKAFPIGLRFVVAHEPSTSATAVSADAVPTSKWERVLVDARDLEDPKYNRFYLVIPFKLVMENCRRLASDPI